MKTKTVERLMNETPEHIKQQVSEYADNLVTVKASTIQESSMCISAIPNYVGMYCLGGGKNGLCISFEKKPNGFHRTMMKACLGWEWIDITKN
jgi:hypothetical protein